MGGEQASMAEEQPIRRDYLVDGVRGEYACEHHPYHTTYTMAWEYIQRIIHA